MFYGITGRKFSGKDTTATEFTKLGYTQMRFADPLKTMLRAFYGLFPELSAEDIERRIEGDLKETADPYLMGKTPRYAMQTLGTEWGRVKMGARFWVSTLLRRAQNVDKVVVSDVRFENEAQAIRDAGGKIVKVTNPLGVNEPNSLADHISEREIDLIQADVVLSNDRKSIEPLTRAVQAIVQQEQGL